MPRLVGRAAVVAAWAPRPKKRRPANPAPMAAAVPRAAMPKVWARFDSCCGALS